MERTKGLRGLDLALSRPRWALVVLVAIAGGLLIANEIRLGRDEFDMPRIIALATGLVSTALLVGITGTRHGTLEDSTWEALFFYAFGALVLALPQALLGPFAAVAVGGRSPSSHEEFMGAIGAGVLQVGALVLYCLLKGTTTTRVHKGGVAPDHDLSRWD